MALVDTKKMFKMAYKNGYAIGAFNVNNMEITQGIISAIAEEKAPLILQISKGARSYASMSYLRAIIDVAVKENPDIPIVMHLDHGDSFELCKQCVDDGFTSVMIDASSKPFEENITVTKKVVEYAQRRNFDKAISPAVLRNYVQCGPVTGPAGYSVQYMAARHSGACAWTAKICEIECCS